MNRHLYTLITILTIIILFTSCANHIGTMSGNAVITDSNFRILGTVMGQSSTTKILGIGGLSKDALVFEAKNNLYNNYSLKEGQALTNITVDFKNSYYLFVIKTKATITAEIVDFNPVRIQSAENDSLKKSNYNFYKRYGYQIGEKIYFRISNIYREGTIKTLFLDYMVVNYKIGNDNTDQYIKLNYNTPFKTSGSFYYKNNEYGVGEPIKTDISGMVVGIRKNQALIKNEKINKIFLIDCITPAW